MWEVAMKMLEVRVVASKTRIYFRLGVCSYEGNIACHISEVSQCPGLVFLQTLAMLSLLAEGRVHLSQMSDLR